MPLTGQDRKDWSADYRKRNRKALAAYARQWRERNRRKSRDYMREYMQRRRPVLRRETSVESTAHELAVSARNRTERHRQRAGGCFSTIAAPANKKPEI